MQPLTVGILPVRDMEIPCSGYLPIVKSRSAPLRLDVTRTRLLCSRP